MRRLHRGPLRRHSPRADLGLCEQIEKTLLAWAADRGGGKDAKKKGGGKGGKKGAPAFVHLVSISEVCAAVQQADAHRTYVDIEWLASNCVET